MQQQQQHISALRFAAHILCFVQWHTSLKSVARGVKLPKNRQPHWVLTIFAMIALYFFGGLILLTICLFLQNFSMRNLIWFYIVKCDDPRIDFAVVPNFPRIRPTFQAGGGPVHINIEWGPVKGKRHNPAAAAAARLQFAPGRTRRTTPDSFAVSEGANERASSSVGFFFLLSPVAVWTKADGLSCLGVGCCDGGV